MNLKISPQPHMMLSEPEISETLNNIIITAQKHGSLEEFRDYFKELSHLSKHINTLELKHAYAQAFQELINRIDTTNLKANEQEFLNTLQKRINETKQMYSKVVAQRIKNYQVNNLRRYKI